MTSPAPHAAVRRGAFTLVELLAATAVFIGLMLLLVTATNQTGEMWRRSSSKIEQFQQARRGFESMTRKISQATLNTYWDYHYPMKAGKPDRSQVPDGYMRQSELRIRSGQSAQLLGPGDSKGRPTHCVFFQAPLGFVDDDLVIRTKSSQTHKPLNNLLNTWGYYVEVNDDANLVPEFIKATGTVPARIRSRLLELMEPSETVKIDDPTLEDADHSDPNKPLYPRDPNWDNPKYLGWFAEPISRPPATRPVRVLAENIVALVILPRLTPQDEAARLNAKPKKTELLCPLFDYDSKRLANSAAGIADPNKKATDPDLNPKNQLPPVVTVAMVAIDETSAQRLGDPSTNLKLNDYFKEAKQMDDDTKTTEPGDGDLYKLERQLIEKNLTYRIFVSNIGIRGAKWSRWQEN
jgi:uncharacterized protein (TIGR02599 family)